MVGHIAKPPYRCARSAPIEANLIRSASRASIRRLRDFTNHPVCAFKGTGPFSLCAATPPCKGGDSASLRFPSAVKPCSASKWKLYSPLCKDGEPTTLARKLRAALREEFQNFSANTGTRLVTIRCHVSASRGYTAVLYKRTPDCDAERDSMRSFISVKKT